jgi:spore germination cell wall hydrolase CwlJ-like protein
MCLILSVLIVPIHISDTYTPETTYKSDVVSAESVKCMAFNIVNEAANQSIRGMVAVAWTVLNRTQLKKYSSDICEVVFQKHQFSWTDDSRRIAEFEAYTINKKFILSYPTAVLIAKYVMLRQIDDPTRGATYYVRAGIHRKWMSGMLVTASIGSHIFLKPIEQKQMH